MSVAEDGNEQAQPGETPRQADRAARHRIAPTASATARIPVLPEPFNPAKPTFPAGAAIPRQRRNGPTAIATASIPAVPVEDDPDLLDEPLDEPLDDFPADLPADLPADAPELLYDDPATVGTLAGEVRASTAVIEDEPVALTKSPALVDPADFAAPAPAPAPDSAAGFAADSAAGFAVDSAVDDEPEPQSIGVAAVVVTADDSPTVADYVPPAFAIVTDEPADEDGPDYRGSRRRAAAWRRYPVGAVAVAVLILLVTAAVVLQLVRSTGGDTTPTAEASSPRFPGVGGLPELTRGATPSPSPSTAPSSASPSPSRSKSSAPAAPPASASASPSKSAASVAPPPLTAGQLVGAGSTKCLEYRAGENDRAVIDNCDARGSGRSNQRWTFQGDGSVRADGGCLDVENAGTGNGNAVHLFTCNGTPAQKWTLRADGTLLNPRSGRCLDVANGGTGAGSPVIIWDCSGASNQKWTLQAY